MTCVQNQNTNGLCPVFSFDGNNHITGSGYTYNAAGDLTSDGANTYQYDAEGRMISENNSAPAVFNPLGFLVYANGGSNLWDPEGGLLAMVLSTGEQWAQFVPGIDGRPHLAVYNVGANDTDFIHRNLLGSTSMSTNASGSVTEDILYYPWGQWWTSAGTVFEYHYATFNAAGNGAPYRSYNQNIGRWWTPDPLGGDMTNPQSFNRYAYALNNPETLVDPLGLTSMCYVGGKWTDCQSGGNGGGNPVGSSGSFDPCAPTSSSSNSVCTTALQFGAGTSSNWDEFDVLQSTSGTWRPVYAPGSTWDDATIIGYSLSGSGFDLIAGGLLSHPSWWGTFANAVEDFVKRAPWSGSFFVPLACFIHEQIARHKFEAFRAT